MKTLQVTAPNAFVMRDLPIPKPGPGEVLLRINAVTTCPQWDLHLRHNEPMFIGHQFIYPYLPGQPGHEATGIIEATDVNVDGLAVGDRVSTWRDPGHDVPGCYAQYVVRRAAEVIRVPADLSDDALAPIELAMCVATVFRMLEGMDAIRGRNFGISGLGPAGLVAVQMAHAAGAASIFGFDWSAPRRELAVRLGATAGYDPRHESADGIAALRLQSAIDCVGSRGSVEFLMDHTADVVALFGVQREDYIFRPQHYSLTLCGYKGHSRESAEYAVDLIRQRKLDLAALVTHRMPLQQYAAGIDLLETQQAVKVCFLPWAVATE